MPVLRAKRNLKMHLVPPFTSQIHNPMPITFFSEYTTKAKTIMQGINTDSFLTVRLVKEKKKRICCARKWHFYYKNDRWRPANHLSLIPTLGGKLEEMPKGSFQVEEPMKTLYYNESSSCGTGNTTFLRSVKTG